MPRWARNKAPTAVKKQYFELIREGCMGAAVARRHARDATRTIATLGLTRHERKLTSSDYAAGAGTLPPGQPLPVLCLR